MANEFVYIPNFAILGGIGAGGNVTAQSLATTYSHYVSGSVVGYMFQAEESQTSGTFRLWTHFNVKTGSPTTIRASIYRGAEAGDQPSRPKNEAYLNTTTLNVSAIPINTLHAFDFTGVSLTKGKIYWILITNESDTPASNWVSYAARISLVSSFRGMNGIGVTTGFSSNPTLNFNSPAYIIKYDSGLIRGNPYCVLKSSAANNTNMRGNRHVFPWDVKVSGLVAGAIQLQMDKVQLVIGSTVVAETVLETGHKATGMPILFPEPITIPANTVFYSLYTFTTNSTVNSALFAGLSAPTEVTNLYSPMISTVNSSSLSGLEASAEPGAYSMQLILDEINPPSTGGETSHTFQY